MGSEFRRVGWTSVYAFDRPSSAETDCWRFPDSMTDRMLIGFGCSEHPVCGSRDFNRNRFTSLLRPHDLHNHPLGLLQRAKACTLDDRDVDKHILLAVLAGNEPEPLGWQLSPSLERACEHFEEYIREEVLADELVSRAPAGSAVEEWTFDGETARVGIERVHKGG